MSCTIDKQTIEDTIKFHGHTCPGLAIGIRLSELAIKRLDIQKAQNPVCVAETDMCALDAVQYLTGCTFGKGNLIHKDYGKSGFTFFDRKKERGFRAVFKNDFRTKQPDQGEMMKLINKKTAGSASEDDLAKIDALKQDSIIRIMEADLDDLFTVEEISLPPVRPASVLESIKCEQCNEMAMESRIRRFGGKNLCIPCFMEHEQKI